MVACHNYGLATQKCKIAEVWVQIDLTMAGCHNSVCRCGAIKYMDLIKCCSMVVLSITFPKALIVASILRLSFLSMIDGDNGIVSGKVLAGVAAVLLLLLTNKYFSFPI